MFLNREKEIQNLESILTSDKAELINMYGRRRLGKTEILNEMAKRLSNDYKVLYNQFTEVPSELQLEEISRELKKLYPQDATLQAAQIENWEGFFKIVMTFDKMICLFDEFPYLVEVDSAIPSIIQKVWDTERRSSRTKILLCGSYVSIMEELMGKNQPLFKRFTQIIDIEPFDFTGIREFISDASFIAQVYLYLIFGGNPYYFDGIKDKDIHNLEKVLSETAFSKYSAFSHEVPLEFRAFSQKPHLYMGTLLAIVNGKTTASKIGDSIRIKSSNIPRILNTLTGIRMIKRIQPFLAKKPIQYQIADPYTRFWMKYLRKRPRSPNTYLKNIVLPTLDEFLSKPGFEEFCKEILLLLSEQGKFSDQLEEVHTFYDEISYGRSEPKESIEIDIIAYGSQLLIFGECKWSKKPPQIREISHFMNKCQKFTFHSSIKYKFPTSNFKKIVYILFTKEPSKIKKLPPETAQVKIASLNTLEKWINMQYDPSKKIL